MKKNQEQIPPYLYPPAAILDEFDLDTRREGLIQEGYYRRFTADGFKVIELDVQADPKKRDPEWLAREKRRIKNPKAFRQEYCVRGDARILTAEMSWVQARSLKLGAKLVGFDENLYPYFKFRPSLVENVRKIQALPVKVVTDRGTVTVSSQHQFVIRGRQQIDGAHIWIQARHLRSGDQILYFGAPWEAERTYSAGWMAGMYDGEGHIGRELGFSQNEGVALDRMRYELESRGFDFYEGAPNNGEYKTLIIGRAYEAMKLLGTVRPERLIAKAERFWNGRSTIPRSGTRYASVWTVRCGNEPEMFYAVQTSTRTLISDGYFSHNCRDWTVGTGDDFYPEFSAYYPERIEEDGSRYRPGAVYSMPSLIRGLPVDRGWDFGYRHSAVVWTQYSPFAHRLYVLRELMPSDMEIGPFADLVLYLSGQKRREELHEVRTLRELARIDAEVDRGRLPPHPWFTSSLTEPLVFRDFSGPEALRISGTHMTETKEKTDADILRAKGIQLNWRAVGVNAREGILRDLLRPHDDGYSGVLFDPYCRILIAGFGGGIVYPEPTKGNPEPEEPKKDGVYEHLHDALGYTATSVVPKVKPRTPEQIKAALAKGGALARSESRPNKIEVNVASRRKRYERSREDALAAESTEENYLE